MAEPWLPIESAPKDGTKIDVWVEEFSIGPAGAVTRSPIGRKTDVWWDVERHYYGGKDGTRIGEVEMWVHNDKYSPCNQESVEVGGYRITHYMPLPAPPKETP